MKIKKDTPLLIGAEVVKIVVCMVPILCRLSIYNSTHKHKDVHNHDFTMTKCGKFVEPNVTGTGAIGVFVIAVM